MRWLVIFRTGSAWLEVDRWCLCLFFDTILRTFLEIKILVDGILRRKNKKKEKEKKQEVLLYSLCP